MTNSSIVNRQLKRVLAGCRLAMVSDEVAGEVFDHVVVSPDSSSTDEDDLVLRRLPFTPALQ